MSFDWMTSDDLSMETLRELFDTAMYETDLDRDGDLVIKERYKVSLTIHGGTVIRFLCAFGIEEGSEEAAVDAFCNRINDNLVIIRACRHGETTLLIDWYIPVHGGITKKCIVVAFRRFLELVSAIGEYDTDDLIQ